MNKNIKFSVLMSVYQKENPKNLSQAIESIYANQTLKPNEIILIEDGLLTKELYLTIETFKKKLGNIFITIPLNQNLGLGNALKIGIKKCKYEYIARMDTDDIAHPKRFEEQIKYLKNNPNIDVLGTFMTEFIEDTTNIICIKEAPLNNIKNYIKYRSPINHPTVIYKKSKVLSSGNYKDFYLNEDIYLWARMISNNCQFANLSKSLLYFRITNETYKRRGGLKYIKSELKLQKALLRLGIINWYIFTFNIFTKTIIRILPNEVRKLLYLKILRKNYRNNIAKF